MRVPVFSPPQVAAGRTTSASWALGREEVLDDDEEAFLGEDRADAGQLGKGHGRIGAADPQYAQRALLGVAEHLEGVRGRAVVRDGLRVDVPHPGQVGDVLVVLPVAESGQVAVGPAFPGVLGGGLPVHLQDARTGPSQHAPDQVQVVDLYGRRGRLVGLVDALQHGRQQPVRRPQDLRRLPDPGGGDVADALGPLRRAGGDAGLQLVEADGVGRDVRGVDAARADDLVQKRVEQGEVRPHARGEVDRGPARHLGRAGVHAHQPGRVATRQPVQDPHPLHRLGLGEVVAEEGDDVRVVDVVVASRLSVAAEGLLQCLGRRRRAQTCVAVEVVGADAGPGEDGEGVVLLQEELPRGVEADRAGPPFLQQPAGAGDDAAHRGLPVRLHQPPVLTDQRPFQPVPGAVGLPAEQVLGAETAVIDAVEGSSPYTDDPAVPDRDVHGVTVGVQDRRGLDPPVHLLRHDALRQVGVHARGPRAVPAVRRTAAPRPRDAVHRPVHTASRTHDELSASRVPPTATG